MTDYSEKKLKAVKKEGGKKGQDLSGMAAMGTLFQQAVMSESEGKLELLEMALAEMNKEVDPEAEERRGGAGEVAKIVLSASDDTFACIVHVPEMYTVADKNERGYAFTAKEWAEAAFATLPGDGKGAEYVLDTPTMVKITYKKDAEAGRYPGKAKDNVSGQSFAWLRSKSLVPADDDSDDEMVFGDDDMPGF
eukprot:TRINITY_DN2558_c0_g2_i2.p1 TRINITY_DN2558_c0_g2~~TRINITY_DN2558_c0_g2_i2.p1  ORF type:complete len:193 (+),score=117.17 TRINITY_DN2558_c0_g2_i2:66-644(+)